MTPEQRLNRLERIARLLAKGNASKKSREQDEKLKLLVGPQFTDEERQARIEQWRAEIA